MTVFKNIIFLLAVFLISLSTKAQIIDTVVINEIAVYHVNNQNPNSHLFWEVSGGKIISENPTQADSILIQWYDQTGIFTLSVYEQSEFNCVGELFSVEILIREPENNNSELDIPNVFTPNEDGINDYFKIGYKFPPENYKITIFNRWGNTVFETHDIKYSWDGRTSGEYCSPGVYYYVIQYQSKGKIETKNGFLHLFR